MSVERYLHAESVTVGLNSVSMSLFVNLLLQSLSCVVWSGVVWSGVSLLWYMLCDVTNNSVAVAVPCIVTAGHAGMSINV